MKYTIRHKKTKRFVYYKCPACTEPLNSLLTEAGNTDFCPECRHRFTVPGIADLRELEASILAAEIEQQKKEKLIRERAEKLLEKDQQSEEPRRKAISSTKLAGSPLYKSTEMEKTEYETSYAESYRLNLWAWRLFMVGVFFFFLGGIGLFFQIPALYLAAQASSKSNGRYGERLWRSVRNYLIIVAIFVVSCTIPLTIFLINDDHSDAGAFIIIIVAAVLIHYGIYLFLRSVYKKGIQPDTDRQRRSTSF